MNHARPRIQHRNASSALNALGPLREPITSTPICLHTTLIHQDLSHFHARIDHAAQREDARSRASMTSSAMWPAFMKWSRSLGFWAIQGKWAKVKKRVAWPVLVWAHQEKSSAVNCVGERLFVAMHCGGIIAIKIRRGLCENLLHLCLRSKIHPMRSAASPGK